jgi:signal transduction histidine kinase
MKILTPSFWKKFPISNTENLSPTDLKLVIFTTQAGILCFAVSVVYIFIDVTFNKTLDLFFASGAAITSVVSVYLNRKGFHNAARIVLIVGADIVISCAVFLEPFEAGTGMLFSVIVTGTIVGFGLNNSKITLFLLGFTVCSVLVTTFYSPFEKESFSPGYLEFVFRVTLLITIFFNSFLVYLAIRLNFLSESRLEKSALQIQQKNNELVKVNSELDRFVYSASHDLKSPITSLRGLVNLSRLIHDPSELKSHFSMMEERLIHLDKFISDIANYSRNARQTLRLSSVNVRKLIDDYLTVLMHLPEANSVKVSIEVPHHLTIISDKTRLEMVLGNIISNAFKYYDSSKGNSFIAIKLIANESTIEIEIEDNGIGIPNDYLGKIFDMFTRAHETAKGAGLGLYIVKETLLKLNGSIRVESNVGAGSKFTILLPVHYDQL